MDILNWLYLVKKKFTRTSVENPDTDLIALGANVGYIKRGDKYQTYAVPFGSAIAEVEGNVLRTGIYDTFPFAVGPTVMTKTTTKVIDTPASPTSIAVDLQGWRLSGTVETDGYMAAESIYLGSLEFPDSIMFWWIFPWKTTGTVYAYNQNEDQDIYTPLANGALMYDNDSGDNISTDIYITTNYYPGGVDLFLNYHGTSPANELQATISYQFEFLHPTVSTPQFYYY